MSPLLNKLYEIGLLRDVDVQLIEALCRIYATTPGDATKAILALACRASGDGHVCLDLNKDRWDFPTRSDTDTAASGGDTVDRNERLADFPTPTAALALLETCKELVDHSPEGIGAQPFVLEHKRLYLRRFWNYEKRTAERLREMARSKTGRDPTHFEQAIAAIPDDQLNAAQRKALRMAIENRLTIITGGPGTGKTHVAAHLLRLCAQVATIKRSLRIRTAAPTGKAATRIDESLAAIPENELLQREPAGTIDRLLGRRQDSPYFRHNRANPLPADIVLIDEMSMLDLPKMAKLLEAIDTGTQLILLGDKDQLASVEPGSVMAELCQSQTLAPCMVSLTESHRFPAQSPIARLSQAVRDGQASTAWELIRHNDNDTVTWHSSSGVHARQLPDDLKAGVRAGYERFLNTKTPAEAFAALDAFRVLCALRHGPQGVIQVNRAMEDILVPDRRGVFYDHRIVLITTNDYESNLYNGDVGVVLNNPSGEPMVYFAEGNHRFRAISCRLLPSHETAFAMTVHKAQGSGFDRVLAIFPDRESPILTRELIYTAITRTRNAIAIWAEETSFQQGILKTTARNMGLKERLDRKTSVE